ncbi:hypothetical protein KC332_g13310 [Hortaea werneckii]|uniref:BZIP domain-containing protein n=2 Tax=Hortaea werneckii TaxID=91943 RepID=A0A3M7I3W5_HORWE|nr:hypothetical protein KC358_g13312 [Hortaea werneckii]OTA33025.1 hypothetical protein BTJ68_06981 [Hortaea werneckii EXF-2000]KAI6809623.1 hypothetical protein KC350_g12859 [Hortaea werneckii]KAI6910383.1 hypothetical protein KC348_g13233 [Hortaea werneckii]KAI6968234.1 hypothetical protein KC329_g14195 [Hortaea werneckii]
MAAQLPQSPDSSGFQPPSFGDPAFEPQAGFDFEDCNDDSLRNMENNFASMSGYDEYDDIMGDGSHNTFAATDASLPDATNSFLQGIASDAGPANASHGAQGANNHSQLNPFSVSAHNIPPAEAFQNGIVQKRGETVTQRFGQITPPDDTVPAVQTGRKSSASSQGLSTPKMDKSQRARNAAIQRHAKSKKLREAALRKDSADPDAEGSDDDVEDKREKYREKNRVAAAKCRAKKKENVDDLEDRHRELSANNNFMKRQERELRNHLTQLRTLALQHNKESCQCSTLHNYNTRKASEVAGGWGQHRPSPSEMESSINVSNPGPFDIMGRHHSMINVPASQRMPMPARPRSFASPSNYAFASVTTQQSMQDAMHATAAADDVGSHPFSNYLQSSPGGLAGFS